MARKGLLPYRVPLLDGAFWFSAQFVLASIWPTSPLLAWFSTAFCGLELPVAANWVLIGLAFGSPLGPAHVWFTGGAQCPVLKCQQKLKGNPSGEYRLATVGPGSALSLISGQFCPTPSANCCRKSISPIFVVNHNASFCPQKKNTL